MPALGDFVGSLMSEITLARMQADLATVRIAQLYASHPLLKKFSAPRMRLPEVSLDVPVAIENAGDAGGAPGPTPADWEGARTSIDAIIEQELANRKARLAPAALADLKGGLDNFFTKLEKAEAFSVTDAAQAADRIYQLVEPILTKGPFEEGAVPAMPDGTSAADASLVRKFRLEFSKLVPLPSRVQVLATAAQLKDAGPPEDLVRLKLSISEEGVEWSQSDPNDSSSALLVPE